jgi:response regulator RpfG family c-di-GMP phosphodiesterase
MNSPLFAADKLNKTKSSPTPRILVVDDEQDNLDLLYRTFRKEFAVFRADSGVRALEIPSQEGEMEAIISDQRMSEMKGTEFLSRTVSDFPDRMRIILTGYTDINDLIDAINSGQVHKYINKPWELEQLKLVVLEETQNYDLLKQRSEELVRTQAQNALLSVIVEIARSSQQLLDCVLPLASAFWQNFGADAVVLQLIEHGALVDTQAICGDSYWDFATDPSTDSDRGKNIAS